MQKFILTVLTFAALCLTQWAYAQPPRGGRPHGDSPVVRGQAEPAQHQAPAIHPRRDIGREQPPRYTPAPPPRHVAAPPPPREPAPEPRHHRSFLEICFPFLSLGISK